MTPLVVDASVAAKWFLPEEFSAQAVRLLSPDYERLAPDFVLTEFAQVVLKRVRVGDVSIDDGRRDSLLLSSLVTLKESRLLVPGALEIAHRFNRSIYDSLYVCLALRTECQLVTADLRLYNALSRDLSETMLWIGDIPLEPTTES